MDEHRREQVLQNYRLAYRADTMVNWCPQLGTVLANDEVKDGLSVRGGYPVVQKRMKQWLLRVTAYAQRMLDGLETLQWSESLKEIQRNWIGRSEGAQVFFDVRGFDRKLEIFTTRPTRSSASPSWSSLPNTNGSTSSPRPKTRRLSRITSNRPRNAPSASASPRRGA